MALSVTPPPLQGPTAKEKKYDRQLRLWAASGQKALEEAHVLLFNHGAGVVGVETLKNLVLPGVGNFTIVDEHNVVDEDLGVNFFLAEESLGRSRAEECCRYLEELNPEVIGHAIHQSMEDFLVKPERLKLYSLILVTSPSKVLGGLKDVALYARTHSIPLFYIHSNGFYSQFSVQLPEAFPIVDTHPDPASMQDLRLLNPWPELEAFVGIKTHGLEKMSDHDHGHIPYLVLLLYYLELWKASHDGKYPDSYAQKSEFRSMVRTGARKNSSEGGEENFDEAVGAVLKSLNPPSISSGLKEVFESPLCQNPTVDSANFWLIAHAISTFHQTHGVLPLPGGIPDMKAQSTDYIQLQNLYKLRARLDLAEISHHVRTLETHLHRPHPISAPELEAFCKNAAHVKLITGQALRLAQPPSTITWSPSQANTLLRALDDEASLLPLSLCFLALDQHLDTHGPLPPIAATAAEAALETQQRKMKWDLTQFTDTILESLTKAGTVAIDAEAARARINKVIMELARAGPAELHNISAATGGMVAQEVIKVLTRQYVPVDNTCVFDGIRSVSQVFRIG